MSGTERVVPAGAVRGWCRICKHWTWIADFRCGEHDPLTRIPYRDQRQRCGVLAHGGACDDERALGKDTCDWHASDSGVR